MAVGDGGGGVGGGATSVSVKSCAVKNSGPINTWKQTS